MNVAMPEWLETFQKIWLQTSTTNKLIMVGMLCAVVGLLSQVTRMTNPNRKYKGKTANTAAMEMLTNLELQNVKSSYQKAREFSRRYDYMMQLSAKIPKEDVEPEYNIYVPVEDKSELRGLNAGEKVKAWLKDNPQMAGTFERAQKSCEKAEEFERELEKMPEAETKDEFDTSLMTFKKYREVEAELVQEAIRNSRPLRPKFKFHFYHRTAKGRSTAEVTKEFEPSELAEICSEIHKYDS